MAAPENNVLYRWAQKNPLATTENQNCSSTENTYDEKLIRGLKESGELKTMSLKELQLIVPIVNWTKYVNNQLPKDKKKVQKPEI